MGTHRGHPSGEIVGVAQTIRRADQDPQAWLNRFGDTVGVTTRRRRATPRGCTPGPGAHPRRRPAKASSGWRRPETMPPGISGTGLYCSKHRYLILRTRDVSPGRRLRSGSKIRDYPREATEALTGATAKDRPHSPVFSRSGISRRVSSRSTVGRWPDAWRREPVDRRPHGDGRLVGGHDSFRMMYRIRAELAQDHERWCRWS